MGGPKTAEVSLIIDLFNREYEAAKNRLWHKVEVKNGFTQGYNIRQ